MKFITIILLVVFTTPLRADCVIMLHGLARSSSSFFIMQTALEGIGYDVINIDYPSTKERIEELSTTIIPTSIESCKTDEDIHFVTHSMGGILVRYYLKNAEIRPKILGKIVMMGPPNKGSPIVDKLADVPGFELWNGEAGGQLGTDAQSIPNLLGAVDYPLGVIAGNQTVSPVFSALIDGPDDGKVSVESTKVAGMHDHIILPVTHTFMMNNPAVFKQVAHFLREGKFKHPE